MKGTIQHNMSLLLLSLLQQGRLSKVVIVGAALLFIAGVALLVYFYRRYQRIEKEPEEDWDLSRHSLFVNVAPPSQSTEEAAETAVVPAVIPAVIPKIPTSETKPIVRGDTDELASVPHLQSPPPAFTEPSEQTTSVLPSEPAIERASEPASEPIKAIQPALVTPPPPVEPLPEERMTQVLASPSPIAPIVEPIAKTESEHELGAFDEDVWAGLEVAEQSPTRDGETTPLHALTERLPGARVDERSHREPFEPPRIEPLTGREQASMTRELHSSSVPAQATRDEAKESPQRDTVMFGTKAGERDARPLTDERPAIDPMVAASGRVAEPSVAGARAYRAPAGSILGLPAEASQGPLILGQSARQESDTGIGALTNYGKDLSPKAGLGGTIALLIVVGLLGGGVLLYLFVPSVHSRVGTFIGRVRGTDTQASAKPKVQIFPAFRQEVNKNIVTAKGAIDNISDEPLENLEVEVSLQRGADAPPEIRRIAVTPNPLPTNTRGAFEFDYDGKRDTGFVSGKITRVFSNGSEIKFRAPNQP